MLGAVAAAADDDEGRNLLRNPSFEQPHPTLDHAPFAWTCGKIYGKGPTHFERSTEARTGTQSCRMTSLHVTQYVYQDLTLPEGTVYTFRVHAKGSGKLRLFAQPRVGREALKGGAMSDWTLTDRWLLYETSGQVPEKTQFVRFHLCTPMTGCDVFLDDAEVTLGKPETSAPATPETSAPEGLFNLTPLCRLECVPFAGIEVAELCDGETRWGGLAPEHRPGRGGRFALRFPQPARVAAVELAQGSRFAESYLIDGDSNGDGSFDTTLVRVTGTGRREARARHAVAPVRVSALRLCGLQGDDRYGRCYPYLREFAVYVLREPWMQAPPAAPKPPPGTPELHPGGVPRALPAPTRDLETPMSERTARGVFIEGWMFGLGKETPPPFEKLRALDAFLWQLDYVGADHVTLFPHRTSTRCPIWPSQVVEGSSWDVLTPLVSKLKERQVRTFVIFGKTSKRLQPDLSWPEWFGRLLAEVAARGAHGASLCADEYPQCGGSPDPAVYKAAVKEELGLDEAPGVRQDTDEYRRWQLLYYHQIAQAHRQAGERALAENPDFLFQSNWRIDPIALNQTYTVLAYDILARETGVSYFGTDPYYTETGRRTYMERAVKVLVAAARPRGALPVLNGGSWDFLHLDRYAGIQLNGSAVAAVMHGAAGVSFYRLNYLFLNNKSHLVHEAFRMIEWLDHAGLRASRPPKTIAMLRSRASADFWQLRQELSVGADLKVAGIRGYVCEKTIEELLLRHSRPFEIRYLDREDDLTDLGEYALVMLPFPYAVSDKAAAAVEAARQAGASIVLCERLGDADETGALRPAPVFRDWSERERVTFVANVADEMTKPEFRNELLTTLDGLLGDRKPFAIETYGRNVEAVMRETDNGRKLLAVINWERGEAVADLRLRLLPGAYRVTQCDGYGTRPAAIAERQELTADDLAGFRVHLERDQVRVFEVRPVK